MLNSRVLVAHEIGADNTFLPGGHIESGEKAVDALVREVVEEIGVSPVVRQHIGSIEHTWRNGSEEHHEINLVFQMDLPSLDSAKNPPSHEDHLEFFWIDTADIADHNLLPTPMSELVTCELQRSLLGINDWRLGRLRHRTSRPDRATPSGRNAPPEAVEVNWQALTLRSRS